MIKLLIFIIGLAITIVSHPRILNKFKKMLFDQGLVTPRYYPREETEIFKFAGANLSLFAVGIILMLIGIFIRNS